MPPRKQNNDKKPGICPFKCKNFTNSLKRFCCSVKIITLLLWGNRRKTQCGTDASVGIPVGCVRIAKAALCYCTCGNQFLQLDPEQKPSPLGDRFPPRRGKMSHSDKKGNRWRVAPDEGYLGQNVAVLRPHQSPAVTASPDRGKPSCGKLISMYCTCVVLPSENVRKIFV